MSTSRRVAYVSFTMLYRAVKYHRLLGILAWVFATLHMVLFQLLWVIQVSNAVFV
jgi:hypothetical protein